MNAQGVNLRKCLSRAKKDGSFHSNLDFTQASEEVKQEYNITEQKRQQLVNFLHKSIENTKIKEFKTKVKPEYPKIIRKNRSHKKMRKFAQELPTSRMTKYLHAAIMTAVGVPNLAKAWPEMLKQVMDEVEIEFFNITHEVGVNCKVRPVDGSDPHIHLAPNKFFGRTARYDVYLLHRSRLEKKLFISYPLMRRILNQCVIVMPDILINFTKFRDHAYEMPDLIQLIEEEIKVGTKLFHTFHTRVLSISASDNTKFTDSRSRLHYWRTGTYIISSNFTRVILNTINHIIEVTGDDDHIPFLKLYLQYDKRLTLYPSMRDTLECYMKIIETISTIPNGLSSLESNFCPHMPETSIPIFIEPNYFIEAERKIRENLAIKFAPVEKYLHKLEQSYADCYGDELDGGENEMGEGEEFNFEDGYAKIDFYQSFINRISDMVTSEYYSIGQLEQEECKANIKASINALIDDVAGKLALQHEWENRDICEVFEMLAQKALHRPTTTAELMEMGVYMTWANTELMLALTERIQLSLHVITKLMDVTTITEEHIQLNADTVLWLTKIKPFLEHNSAMYETVKFEFEERLQRAVIKINEEIAGMEPYLVVLNDMDDCDNASEYVFHINKLLVRIRSCDEQKEWINSEEKTFKFPISPFQGLEELKKYIYPFFRLVKVCQYWRRSYNAWMDGPFEFLDHESAEEIVDGYFKELIKTQKTYRIKLRVLAAEGNPRTFKGSTDDPDPMNYPAPMKLCQKALDQIKDFRPCLTLMDVMCQKALLPRHWAEMSLIAGFDLTPTAGTTLRKLFELNLMDNIDNYEIISSGALKEQQLLESLIKMQGEWDGVIFKTSVYKDTGISILSGLDDIQAILDDHIMKTLTMRGSVFVKPYEDQVRAWYEKITRINDTVDVWGKVQVQWLYLLPIFSSKDIIAQMPNEGVLFREVDATYRRYMAGVAKDPRVVETAGSVGLLEAMQNCIELLDKINDGVTSYLEKKRLYFPRFFFLSNDEMLEILSETKDPLRVQPHLRKCFEAINRLEFDESLKIHAMFSQENERIPFNELVNVAEAGGSVEKWLLLVEAQMLVSVLETIGNSYKDYRTKARTDWVVLWPGQVVLAVSQIYWTMHVHSALNPQDTTLHLVDFVQTLKNDLQDIVMLIRNPKLSNLNRITIKALIVIDVHAKDVVQELYNKKVDNDNEFKWLAQLRYYWEEDLCLARIVNATVRYACEYLGNSDRLVITPLTDRCYRTLVGAYHLHLNGAPEGPAGTGKTETTKDLAKALAVQCVVFNCSDGLDYKAMGKFFKGLASSGAWACFDEFNRIEIEVLSVVAQQILSIVMAVRGHVKKFLFEGTELTLNPACYVCITMNPGYAGRSELPDNLKVLFRTVAMMVPDYAMIGEISLYSYGFSDARTLSVKIVTTYRLCSEQLSSQNHYDYGMRAVKSVLSAAGNNKRNYPDENEDIILLRSITDVNLPKFLNHDVPLFNGIISDLFPGLSLPQADYRIFIKCMKIACSERNLQPRDSVIVKVIQTYEMMIVRHGFMMVGDPLSGKTNTLKVLADALGMMNVQGLNELKVKYQFINPKSITMGQLYGCFDPVSYEWTDGVVATCFRRFVVDTCPDRKWVIFDGPVDAVWIENMNTVLDDNKKLCLMSGEVMTMTNVMSMIFEVADLAQASPATVSRCGMIYMESDTLGWTPFFESWLVNLNPLWFNENTRDLIIDMFKFTVPDSLWFIRKHSKAVCVVGPLILVRSCFKIFELTMNEVVTSADDIKFFPTWLVSAFMYAMVWGLGGIMDKDSREQYDELLRNLWNKDGDSVFPESFEFLDINLPKEGLLIDYAYNYKLKGSWKYWPEMVKGMRVENANNIQQALIPTVDTVKYMQLADSHIKAKIPFLFVGPTGTGKSFYLQDLLMNQLNQDLYEPAFITFTVKISANQTQDLVISKLNKRKRGTYGPPRGKTAIIFFDDLNMPVKEVYGAQPPIELLRQYFDHKNWYDLHDTSPIYLVDILIIAAMGLVGGSRQEIYSRFLRHFSVFSINDFSDESMVKIYTNVLLLGLKKNGFPSDVILQAQQIVNATLDFYQFAMRTLRPTPAKSHYVFNLRDFSRVVFGCAMIRKESAEDKQTFARLWVHEILRVFYDRLIEASDKTLLFDKLRLSVKDYFKDPFDMVFDRFEKDKDGKVLESSLIDLMFGTYLDLDASEDEIRYEEIVNKETFFNIAMMCLDDYNSTHKTKMDIVLFNYALEHLSKICRILSIPSGCALLVGVSGSGRQSLTKLGTGICQYTFFQPEISKNYGMTEWREDLKKVLKESGGRGKNTTFLFTEGQIKEEGFLSDIDGLLNSGEVPNIFPIDEKQEVMELVRLAAQGGNRNLDISSLAVFSFFIKRCKEKLHIILCFSPIGSSFRVRLRLFPALVNCCTIDWFEDWPEDALEMVAHSWIGDINAPDEIKNSSVIACKHFHVIARTVSEEFYRVTSRKIYVTSNSYLELIKSFTALTNSKQKEIMKFKRRYVVGLEKLIFAAGQVSQMQVNLESLQPELKTLSAKAMAMTREIETETVTVEKASALVKKDEEAANIQAAAAQALKAECEAELALAIPVLEEAIGALNTLKPADITLVKAMKNPPEAVKVVLAAVCVMKEVKPDRINDPSGTGGKILDYWGPSKRILGDMNFLQALKDFDKDNIKVETMAIIRKTYLPHPLFKPNIVAKASSAAEGLCKWIIAMDMYDKVAKEVAPKKAKLDIAEREYSATMKILNEKKSMVEALEAKLAHLNELLTEAMNKQKELQDNVDLCAMKLYRATKLIGGLGGEKSRWTEAANNLQVLYDSLAGDILICCGMIAYLSAMTMQYRQSTIAEWRQYVKDVNIPCSAQFDFVSILGVDIKIQNWNIYGLPRDAFSIENGIIQDVSRRWSLLVDPQSQANLWIKKLEKANDLQISKFSDPNYMKIMQQCIQLGKPCLLENIQEDLEAPLDPVLYKSTFMQAGLTVIALGENVVPYNANFRLYLTSKLRNPHYLPEVFNKVTIINFVLTLTGLQDQLLGIVVTKERPDLQKQREELVIQSAQNKASLKMVEDTILKTLSESQGDILEDSSAIEVLDFSKALAVDILAKQKIAAETEKMIEGFRLAYTPIAEHSAVLYYCISDLPNVDPMYQYSLGWFINLYVSSIETANKSRDLQKRLFFLKEAFTYNLYSNICRSLFEKDKLMFSFILCTKIMMSQDQLNEIEFGFLLTGGIQVENPYPNPSDGWLNDKSWNEICRVSDIKAFAGFKDSFKSQLKAWQNLYDMIEPQESPIPEPWDSKLTPFQKLIIIRLLRPDKITVSINKFIKNELGVKFTIPPPFDIAKSFDDASCLCPLIFILSAGTDPMAALVKFAEVKGYQEMFQSISLGQGQGPIAQAMIEQAQAEGGWVCLQNCHLAVSWMGSLEKLWEAMDATNTDDNFRLWLTSYPSPQFPISMLQFGVKMTNEPPTGLQQNLLRSYLNEPVKNPDFYVGCPGREAMFCRLLYATAFFHAVIQERRTFGPLGWNIPYGFNESDFDISVQQLQMFINEYPDNAYEAVSYLTGECNYGGRVTDDWDRRLIVTILDDFINARVVNDMNYSFSSAGTCYVLPRKNEYAHYIEHINGLPSFHPPEVFGLHNNAGITRDLQVSNLLLDSMIKVEGEGSGGGGETDSLLIQLTGDILEKLPDIFDMDAAHAKYPVVYQESMNTVLVQEMERFNKLLIVIRKSLQDIQKAIKGLITMSNDLEVLQNSLLLGRIPAIWAKVSYPSLKSLPNYIADFVERLDFLQLWFDVGKPKTFWLSGFFFTQAFLTGAKQNYARKFAIPIDQLIFDFEVLRNDNIAEAPADGVDVYGLYTDGAKWDRQKNILAELLPKILYDVLPLTWVYPIKDCEYNETGRYKSPLYKTSERRGILSTTGHSTNYVLPLLLPTDKPQSHWIKRSVALLCQLN
ncbi:dynein axonemal heavy chain 7 [Onthophagus taurus]|uniref:dynein axonemal heavy chain 7 n=1 Tax=Onthophagus taurus TaxID=166361 RepID=UPI0039BDBC6A